MTVNCRASSSASPLDESRVCWAAASLGIASSMLPAPKPDTFASHGGAMNRTIRQSGARGRVSSAAVLVSIMILLSGSVNAFAQETTGSILGTVRDSTGAVVAGARVVVTNAGTNVSSEVVSNDTGAFDVPYLAPGTYSVSVNAAGFKKFVQQTIVVNVGSRANLDATLEAGVVSEEVRVSAAAPLLDTTSASGSAVLDNEAVRSMPVFGNMSALVV